MSNRIEQPCEICSLPITGEKYQEYDGEGGYNEIYWQEQCDCGAVVCDSHIKVCAGCGEARCCEKCGVKFEGDLFCDMECVREMERKQRHESPDFEIIETKKH